MQFPFSFLLLIFTSSLLWAQTPSVSIIYENTDAYNGLKKTPEMAPYLAKIGEVKMIEAKERSSLRLYPYTGIYTLDSVFVSFPGYRSKSWIFPTVNVRDYATCKRFSISHNLPPDYAYIESCEDEIAWKVDKTKTKKILGMTCYHASANVARIEHQIWFTNELAYKDGPFASSESFGCNLPGLVLEHIMGNGWATTAIDIRFMKPNKDIENKVKKLQAWTKTPKPSYEKGRGAPEGAIRINSDFQPLKKWVPLVYNSEAQQIWLVQSKKTKK